MNPVIDSEQDTATFDRVESAVRSYCRQWPTVFDRAVGSWIYDTAGRPYLDFFSGAGALNYGHNHPLLKEALIEYLSEDRVVHSLDMFAVAKREFLLAFEEVILRPRGLEYRVQFPGPGGTNAVEAALKLVRKVTGRTDVICFRRGFHGMTLGALAVTGNAVYRTAAGAPLSHATAVPFDDPDRGGPPDLGWFDQLPAAGPRKPAGVIVEAVQGEGGLNVASRMWLRELARRCSEQQIPLIVDDVQMGCGRTGPFFSFEESDIKPDLVCLSKSISGYGLPMALTLIRQDLDVWRPGEHNGTFRGFNPALVTATAALSGFWRDRALEQSTACRGELVAAGLLGLAERFAGEQLAVRGRGLAQGLVFGRAEIAKRVGAAAFAGGLLIETAGPRDEVLKLMPPLTSSEEELKEGLALLGEAIEAVC